MLIFWQTYEGLKIALIQPLKLPNFFIDIRLSMYWQKAFAKILSKTGLIVKDNRSMADFGYNNNAILETKKFQTNHQW